MVGNFLRISDKKLEALRRAPDRIRSVLFPSGDETKINDDVYLEIDKAWHGIHYLLTGDAAAGGSPLGFLLGGEPIGDVDVGHGPARGFDAEQVRGIADALSPITTDALRGRFDPARMAALAIYSHRAPIDYLETHFENMKEFVLGTAELGAAMIVYLT